MLLVGSWWEECFSPSVLKLAIFIGVVAGGMGGIYVLNSPGPPGAFGRAAGNGGRQQGKTWEFSKPPGCCLFLWHAENTAFTQDCALLQAISKGFQRKLVLGRRRALLNLFAVLEGLGPWLGLHSPACIPHIPDPRWKRQVCLELLIAVPSYLVLQAVGIAQSISFGHVTGEHVR